MLGFDFFFLRESLLIDILSSLGSYSLSLLKSEETVSGASVLTVSGASVLKISASWVNSITMGFLGEFTRVESISSEGVVSGTGVEQREAGDKVAIGLETDSVFLTFLDKPTLRPRTMMVDKKANTVLQLERRGQTLQALEGECGDQAPEKSASRRGRIPKMTHIYRPMVVGSVAIRFH